MKSTLLLILLLTYQVMAASAQQVIRLYGGKAPGSENWTWTEQHVQLLPPMAR